MTNRTKSILKQALELSDAERAELAGALLESLEPPPDTDIDAAWREEIAKRIGQLDSGAVEPIPWEIVRDRLYSRLRELSR
jgi:putative addiction module component (TIGR02574 family)